MTVMADEKKIIIDEDWKKQAQQEKEGLKAKEKEEKAQEPTEEEPGEGRSGPLPQGDLAGLINMLATQALFAMGVLRVKGQEEREPDMEMARYNIDMLQVLEDKTKGNLSDDEAAALKNTLSELRMGFVQLVQGPPPSAAPEE
jgi:Domain of unknown function (DUF1844)